MSPAGYITHHCSAVSAVLYSAKHRMARPPGYATGAHVLAGCLPDRRSTVLELINTPTLSTVFSKHVPGYIHAVHILLFFYVEIVYMQTLIQFSLRNCNPKGEKKPSMIHLEPKIHFDYRPDSSEVIVNNCLIYCMLSRRLPSLPLIFFFYLRFETH